MKIPSFVPLVESERRKRSIIGLVFEILFWSYNIVVLGRIVFFNLIMKSIEELTFNEPPTAWALAIIKRFEYDSRYAELEWSTIGILALIGAVFGLMIGLTGRGLGTWLASLSRIQPNNAEDTLKVQKHWAYARIEGVFVLLLTLVTGWVLVKINIAQAFEVDGLKGAGRLVLQLACGIPGVGASEIPVGFGRVIPFGASLYDGIHGLLNVLVGAANSITSFWGAAPLEKFHVNCIPTEAQYFGLAIKLLIESIYLAFMATFFAVPIAFVLAFFAARNLTRHSRSLRLIYMIIRMYMNISRSIEPLIWAILFAVWIGIGPFAGAMALMVHSVSSLVKQYSEAIEGVDEGPIEALQATGANRVATAWFAVVPQVVLPYLAFTIYRWDINVRMATIIGLVGGGGIGGLLIQEQGLAHWTQVGTIAFLIFTVVWSMDFFSARVREAIQ